MFKILINLFKLFSRKERVYYSFILTGIFISMLLEMLSISLIVPVITFILSDDLISSFFFYNSFKEIAMMSKEKLLMVSLIIMLLVYLIKTTFITILIYYQAKFNYALKEKISKNLLTKYIYEPYSFFLQKNSSYLIRNIKDECDLFVETVLNPTFQFLTDAMAIIGITIIIILFEPIGALVSITFILITLSVYLKLTKKKTKELSEQRIDSDGKRIKEIQQSLNNIVEVKIFSLEKIFIERYDHHNKISANASRFQTIFQDVPRLWLEMVAIMIMVVTVGILLIYNKPIILIIPLLGLFAAAAFKILPSLNRIIVSLQRLRFAIPTMQVITDQLPGRNKHKKNENQKLKVRKNIQFNNVKFEYSEKKTLIINNLSQTIPSNGLIGIYGASGSGKTTLLNLIIGLLQPSQGKILIDDEILLENDPKWINNIGYVPQNVNLFDDTIKNNILNFKVDNINKIQYEFSKKISKVDDFIKYFPDKDLTLVGERGVRISGGQRQRIGIARALYKDPQILIMDEATNSLDYETEKEIINSIIGLKDRKIIFFVTHKKDHLDFCDQIINLT